MAYASDKPVEKWKTNNNSNNKTSIKEKNSSGGKSKKKKILYEYIFIFAETGFASFQTTTAVSCTKARFTHLGALSTHKMEASFTVV